MKRILLATGLAGMMFTSCNSSSSEDMAVIDSTVIPPHTASDTQNRAIPGAAAQPIINPQGGVPVTLSSSGSNVVIPSGSKAGAIPVTQIQPTVTAPGMNPPHGQPNHRCDIAVGAPLNSKPVTATITQPTVQPKPQTIQVGATPAQTVTAPGMNPPHGQPNHRCDIAVGAPLNSKPNPTANTVPAGTVTYTPPGMNPPHGQPNHRCDIAVGAPLNSAPPVKKDSTSH